MIHNEKLLMCKDREPNYTIKIEISGNPHKDLVGIGKSFRLINTPEEDYPRVTLTAFNQIREEYQNIGKPISEEVFNAAFNYYGLGEPKVETTEENSSVSD